MELASREKTFLEHIDELRSRLLRIVVTVIAISLFTFLFGIRKFRHGDLELYLPYPDPFNNIAGDLIAVVQRDMLPDYVRLIVTSPGQAILAQLYVSIFLGVLLGMPVIIHQIGSFVNPALYPNERRHILRLLSPSVILFLVGGAFTYLYVTPVAFRFLYIYGTTLEAQTFITINDLMAFVILFVFAGGLSFQLPIAMWAITALGVVDVEFWHRNLTYAVVAIVIFGAVITPDGSGITMWLIAGPMISLYLAAYLLLRLRPPT